MHASTCNQPNIHQHVNTSTNQHPQRANASTPQLVNTLNHFLQCFSSETTVVSEPMGFLKFHLKTNLLKVMSPAQLHSTLSEQLLSLPVWPRNWPFLCQRLFVWCRLRHTIHPEADFPGNACRKFLSPDSDYSENAYVRITLKISSISNSLRQPLKQLTALSSNRILQSINQACCQTWRNCHRNRILRCLLVVTWNSSSTESKRQECEEKLQMKKACLLTRLLSSFGTEHSPSFGFSPCSSSSSTSGLSVHWLPNPWR